MTTAPQPAKRFRLGSITVTLWPNRSQAGRGYYTTTITRSYRDEHGNWADTASLRPSDLPVVRVLTNSALDWITAHPLDTSHEAEPEAEQEPALAAALAAIDKQFSRS